MARKNRKINKRRGSRTCGHGHHRKNRGSGNRGGFGMAGTHKGRWTWVTAKSPHHFGKRGFKIPVEAKRLQSAINVGEIEQALPRLIELGVAKKKGRGFEVDLTKTSYTKVLGKGSLKHRMVVKAESFSARAAEKIEQAKGKAVPVSEQSG